MSKSKRVTIFRKHVDNMFSQEYIDFIINNNTGKPLDWYFISENPNITMAHVLANPQIRWSGFFLSRNPNITIKNHPNKMIGLLPNLSPNGPNTSIPMTCPTNTDDVNIDSYVVEIPHSNITHP